MEIIIFLHSSSRGKNHFILRQIVPDNDYSIHNLPAFSKKFGGYYRGRLHRTPPSHDTAFPSVVTSFYFNRAKFSIAYNLRFNPMNSVILHRVTVWAIARYRLFYKGDIE